MLCVFSICLPPFRGWTLGAGREAGSYQGDAIREITGSTVTPPLGGGLAMDVTTVDSPTGPTGSGAIQLFGGAPSVSCYGTVAGNHWYRGLSFLASRVVPTGPENVPVHVLQPVIIYLGN